MEQALEVTRFCCGLGLKVILLEHGATPDIVHVFKGIRILLNDLGMQHFVNWALKVWKCLKELRILLKLTLYEAPFRHFPRLFGLEIRVSRF